MSLLRGSADFRGFFSCPPRINDSFPRIIVFLVEFSQCDFRVKNPHFSFQFKAKIKALSSIKIRRIMIPGPDPA